MAFKKGGKKPAGSGRKKGVPNRRRLLRAEEVLADRGKNPVEAIIDLIPYLEPEDQLKAWLDLHKFVEAQKRPGSEEASKAQPSESETPPEPFDPAKLLQLVKQ